MVICGSGFASDMVREVRLEGTLQRLALCAVFLACLVALSAEAGAAVGCGKLQLSPPATAEPSSVRALDANVDDRFAKSPTAASNVEATFRDVARHVLLAFPQADRRYIWQRIISLKCKLVTDSTDLNASQKMHAVDDLVNKFYSPPPP
jgi:hypothetical protein